VGSGEVRVYTDLTPTLGGKEVVSNRPSAESKSISNNQTKENSKEQKMFILLPLLP